LKTATKPYTIPLGFIKKKSCKEEKYRKKRHRTLGTFVFLPKHEPTLKKQKSLIFANAQNTGKREKLIVNENNTE